MARHPQLYSRVGFVHAFRPGITNEEAVAAIIRITGGNFRLLRLLLSQIQRLLDINQLGEATAAIVEAARENLVIGTA